MAGLITDFVWPGSLRSTWVLVLQELEACAHSVLHEAAEIASLVSLGPATVLQSPWDRSKLSYSFPKFSYFYLLCLNLMPPYDDDPGPPGLTESGQLAALSSLNLQLITFGVQ